jgi:hypothetical protein
MLLNDYAKYKSEQTNPYKDNNYWGDISPEQWESGSVFVLYTYAYRMGDLIDESNHAVIMEILESIDPKNEYWQNSSIGSWLTPFYRIEIYPYGDDFDNPKPFNWLIVETAKQIFESLANFPILDEDHHSQLEQDYFIAEIDRLLSPYADDDPIHELWESWFRDHSGDYANFAYDVMPRKLKEYDDLQDS